MTIDRTTKRGRLVGIATAGILGASLVGGFAVSASTASINGARSGLLGGATSMLGDHGGPGLNLAAILSALVGKGTITQPQADALKAAIDAARPQEIRRGPGALGAASTYLGLTEAQIREQLVAGKSLAQIAATVSGKTRDGLVTAIVKAETDRIDHAVTAGKLTAEQATKAKADVATRTATLVDQVGMPGGPGHGRDGGPRGPRPAGTSGAMGTSGSN